MKIWDVEVGDLRQQFNAHADMAFLNMKRSHTGMVGGAAICKCGVDHNALVYILTSVPQEKAHELGQEIAATVVRFMQENGLMEIEPSN